MPSLQVSPPPLSPPRSLHFVSPVVVSGVPLQAGLLPFHRPRQPRADPYSWRNGEEACAPWRRWPWSRQCCPHWAGRRTAGGCGETENLTVPEPFEPGTEAIRQEFLINSRLSASQTPGLKPCVCPGPSGPGTLRFSRLPADARRTRMPPSQGVFLFSGSGRLCFLLHYLLIYKCRNPLAYVCHPFRGFGDGGI